MGGCRPGGGRIPDQKKVGWNQDLLMFPRWVLAALIQVQSKVKKKKKKGIISKSWNNRSIGKKIYPNLISAYTLFAWSEYAVPSPHHSLSTLGIFNMSPRTHQRA